MKFHDFYRVSFYLMLILASLLLCVDATDVSYAMVYPLVVSVACLTAFLTVDRDPDRGISSLLADTLAVAATGLALAEWQSNHDLLVHALGHWLVYLTIIYIFRAKTVSVDWIMFRLALFQVLVGTVISQSDGVGALLFAWAIITLWVLGLFALKREALRAAEMFPSAKPSHARSPRELYPGLINLAFLLTTLRVTLTTLALGGVIFLAMPRRATMAKPQGRDSAGQHLTGFDDEIKLGQFGEILENDGVVMTVEFFDERGNKTDPPSSDPLFRGVTLSDYSHGSWKRLKISSRTFPIILPEAYRLKKSERPRGFLRQKIKLESSTSDVLFGLRPMLEANTRGRFNPTINPVDGSLVRNGPENTTLDYEVRSFRDRDYPQPGEVAPGPRLELGYKRLPNEVRARLRPITEGVISRALPVDQRADIRARAEALTTYLRDSGAFSYTLALDVDDPNLDPVVDFVVNRKEGHCEYFASALTLMLRSVDIPARVVNGFKGGDWNEIASVMTVRQKHAHSWVEVYLGKSPGNDGAPIWITLDPTPASQREESVAKVSGYKANFRQFSDLVRYLWVFYVVGYNADRQNALLYGPIRSLAAEARNGFSIMAQSARSFYAKFLTLIHFRDARSFFSFRGFAVSIAGMALLLFVGRAASRLALRVLKWYRGSSEDQGALAIGAAQFRRLTQLLAQVELERPPSETQDEFARRASAFLGRPGFHTGSVAEIPRQVVEAFYRVRFGKVELSPAALSDLETGLDSLEAALRVPMD